MDMTNTIILIASFVTASGVIITTVVKVLNHLLQPMNTKIDKMDERQCKAFLVDYLSDLENGIEKDSVQHTLACEIYDHYTNDLKKNSYIHER